MNSSALLAAWGTQGQHCGGPVSILTNANCDGKAGTFQGPVHTGLHRIAWTLTQICAMFEEEKKQPNPRSPIHATASRAEGRTYKMQ